MQLFKARIILLCLLLFALTVGQSYAYEVPAVSQERKLSDAQWRQLTNNKAFSYKNEKEQIKEAPKPNTTLLKIIGAIFVFFSSGAGQLLICGAILLLLGYICYKAFFNKQAILFSKKSKSKIVAGNDGEAEDIEQTNWEKLLQEAVRSGNLRLAVRYSYMQLLQLLQEKELIQYRTDKTNHDYYYELADTAYKQPFRELSREYEYTWYGHFMLSDAAYNIYMNTFSSIKKQLSAS